MTAWFPMPWISAGVFVGWQMLNGGPSLLNLLAGVFLAWLLPKMTRRFVPEVASPHHRVTVASLAWTVLVDIIKSNIAVARMVLGDTTQLRSVFVTVPVDTDHPMVITLLASIITMTPGTVSARVHERTDGRPNASIVVHVLDCDDDDELIRDIKDRYEKPLMEIFGCLPSR